MTTGLTELDEATLVARARDRDPAAFELLVRRYQRRIYTLCLRMLNGATGDAEDVAQETFVTAWRRLPEIQHEAAFGSWLYRTATNKCLTVLHRRKPTAELNEESAPQDVAHDPARAAGNTAARTRRSPILSVSTTSQPRSAGRSTRQRSRRWSRRPDARQ